VAYAPTTAESPQQASRRWRTPACVTALVLLALAARLTWVAYSHFSPAAFGDDAGTYDALGRALAAHHEYPTLDGTPELFWPPGYPFVLAGVYRFADGSLRAALVLNAVLGALTVLLIYAIGARAFDRTTGYFAAAITALFPSLTFFVGVTLTEVPFTFLLLLAIWLIVESEVAGRRPLGLAAFVVIGFAALVRGQALLLPLILTPFWWRSFGSWRHALRQVLAAFAIAIVVVAPWSVRNAFRSGTFIPISANAGPDLYIGHSAKSDGHFFRADEFRYEPGLSQKEVEIRLNRDGSRRAIGYAFTHPLRELELSARKLYWLYYSDHDALAWNEGHGGNNFLSYTARLRLSAAADIWYWAVVLCVVLGARTWFSARRPVRLLLVCVVAYWTAIHVVFFGEPRFHAPILPVFALWAAAAVSALGRRLKSET
jgi:4-amino-4-deoxy-L-arabinose transferase-like glycosyltransferase